jgi:hypothetical protein
MMKPKPDEFEISERGLVHKPSGQSLVCPPGDPTKAFVERGHEPDAQYDVEEVKAMALRLWAKHIAKNAQPRVRS